MSEKFFYALDGPLDSMPADTQMRSANLSGFNKLVNSRGGNPQALLEKFAIDPWLAQDPDHYINCKGFVDLLNTCAEQLNDPLFGLHLGLLQEPDVFGCVTALCRAAPTVSVAIQRFIEYLPIVHSPTTIMELKSDADNAEIRWLVRAHLGQNDQANLQAVALVLKLLRQIGGHDFRPVSIKLAIDIRARDLPEIEQKLGCRVYKTDTENAITFPVGVLNHQVASANRLLFKLLSGYLDQVKSAARKTTSERVEDYIRGALPSGHCSIERCAEKLGMSIRTLQTNLSLRGQKFSDILEAQRVEMARAYLEKPELSLDDVASNLGYSEQSSFGRAFKRWTGMTPKQFRRQLNGTGSRD